MIKLRPASIPGFYELFRWTLLRLEQEDNTVRFYEEQKFVEERIGTVNVDYSGYKVSFLPDVWLSLEDLKEIKRVLKYGNDN